MARRADSDHCRACGSDNLFSGFFDADDLAVDGKPSHLGPSGPSTSPGTRWTTFCNECGTEQTHLNVRRIK